VDLVGGFRRKARELNFKDLSWRSFSISAFEDLTYSFCRKKESFWEIISLWRICD